MGIEMFIIAKVEKPFPAVTSYGILFFFVKKANVDTIRASAGEKMS